MLVLHSLESSIKCNWIIQAAAAAAEPCRSNEMREERAQQSDWINFMTFQIVRLFAGLRERVVVFLIIWKFSFSYSPVAILLQLCFPMSDDERWWNVSWALEKLEDLARESLGCCCLHAHCLSLSPSRTSFERRRRTERATAARHQSREILIIYLNLWLERGLIKLQIFIH